jgi:hypothetical protein
MTKRFIPWFAGWPKGPLRKVREAKARGAEMRSLTPNDYKQIGYELLEDLEIDGYRLGEALFALSDLVKSCLVGGEYSTIPAHLGSVYKLLEEMQGPDDLFPTIDLDYARAVFHIYEGVSYLLQYQEDRDLTRAINYLGKGQQFFRLTYDQWNEGIIWLTLGKLYRSRNQWERAFLAFQRSWEAFSKPRAEHEMILAEIEKARKLVRSVSRDEKSEILRGWQKRTEKARMDGQAAYVRQAIERDFNPYIVGDPIREPDMFFGRDEVLAEVRNTIYNNHIAIYGERRIGKTSLLYQLDHMLREVEDPEYLFIPTFVDLQGVPAERLFYTLMRAIARSCQPRVGPLDLICITKKGDYDAHDLVDDLEAALKALVATTDKQIRLVLLLDEGDELNRYDPIVQARLRRVFMSKVGQHLRMIWSGLSIDKEWKLYTSPWYNLFAIEKHLPPFTKDEALRLIEEPVRGIYRYDEQAITLILQYSEQRPFRIQQICLATINCVLAQERYRVTRPIQVTKEDVERAYRGLTAEKAISEVEERGKVELLEKQVAEGGAEYQVNTDRQGDQ